MRCGRKERAHSHIFKVIACITKDHDFIWKVSFAEFIHHHLFMRYFRSWFIIVYFPEGRGGKKLVNRIIMVYVSEWIDVYELKKK